MLINVLTLMGTMTVRGTPTFGVKMGGITVLRNPHFFPESLRMFYPLIKESHKSTAANAFAHDSLLNVPVLPFLECVLFTLQ